MLDPAGRANAWSHHPHDFKATAPGKVRVKELAKLWSETVVTTHIPMPKAAPVKPVEPVSPRQRAAQLLDCVNKSGGTDKQSLQALAELAPTLFRSPDATPVLKEQVIIALGGAKVANQYASTVLIELNKLAEALLQRTDGNTLQQFAEVATAFHRSIVDSFGYKIFGLEDRSKQFPICDDFIRLFHKVADHVIHNPEHYKQLSGLQDLLLSGVMLRAINGIGLSGMSTANVEFKMNDAAGANPSEKLAVAEAGTVGLFKPQGPSEGFKSAPCFKKSGSQELREIVSSLWSELCGGWGHYPLTVALRVQDPNTGKEVFGSLQAWRRGAREYAGTVVEQQLKTPSMFSMFEQHLKDHGVGEIVDIGKVSLDGREGTVNIYELRDNAVRREQQAIDGFSTFDAQSLMLFHLATLQLDVENAANVMLGGTGGKIYPFAIDGGLSAPDKILGTDFNAPCWLKWPQADLPWDQAVADKLERVDVKTQADRLREILHDLPLTLEEAAIRRLQGASLLTQVCAKRGLTPRQTFDIVLNQLEGMVRVAETHPENFTQSLQDQLNAYQDRQRI